MKLMKISLLNLLFKNKKEDYFWRVLDSGNLIFVGAKKSFKIILKDFLDLKVGEKVTQIGVFNGKGQHSLNRTDAFQPYITYVGYRYEKIHIGDPRNYQILLFEVREEDAPFIEARDRMYVGYIVLWDEENQQFELKSPMSYSTKTFRIYRAKFIRYDGRD